MPGDGNAARIEESRTRIVPFACGVGLPNGCTWKGCAAPTRKNSELVVVHDRDAVLHHGMAA